MNTYREVSAEALRWVAAQAVPVEGGLSWVGEGVCEDDLYFGTASALVGAAEATAYGLDCDDIASGALSRLLHLVEFRVDAMPPQGLFDGSTSWLVALRAWATVSGDSRATAAADRLREVIAAAAIEGPADLRAYDVLRGDAGTLIALLGEGVFEARTMLADRLVAEAWDGPTWPDMPGETALMPGWCRGAGGIAQALALTGAELGRPDLVDFAGEAARALVARAMTPDGWRLHCGVPGAGPHQEYNLGWCHGPTGSIRLFTALALVDPRPEWDAAVDACIEAIRASRLPERLYPGFWDNVGRCCGTAGVGMTLLDRFQATGDESYLLWADALADDVISHATVDGDGVRWSNVEFTATPPELPPEPGLMQGALGVASWLARLARLHEDPTIAPPWSVGGSSYC